MTIRYGQQGDRVAQAGGLSGHGHHVDGRLRAGGAVAQVDTITVGGTGTADVVYSVTLEDNTVVTVTWTPGNVSAAADVLLANSAFNGASELGGILEATDGAGDTIVLTARTPGVGWTLAEVTDTDTNYSIANTTANADAGAVPFGLGCILNPSDDDECKLPAVGDLVLKVVTVTPDSAVTGEHLVVTVIGDLDGDGVDEVYNFGTGAAASVAALCDELTSAMNLAFPANSILVTDGATLITLTSELRGLEFQVTTTITDEGGGVATGAAPVVESTDTAKEHELVGISKHTHSKEVADGGTTSQYAGGEQVGLVTEKDIWVRLDASEDPVPSDTIWCRHTASATEQRGAFRTTADSTDCFQVPRSQARWLSGGAKTDINGNLVALMRVKIN